MRTIIAKDFNWEMGHRLPFHTGGCQNIHGHSYKLRVEIEGEPNEQGMVMDYFDMKAIVQPLVDRLDHCFLCDESDAVMRGFFQANPMNVCYVPFPTTAENIAVHLLGEMAPRFRQFPALKRLTVRVHETLRTYAEISIDL